MIVNTARLEGDNPTPPDLIWGQGRDFNNRLVQEINNENSRIDLVVYRLEVDNITNALLAKFNAGVPVRLIVDPGQYTNIIWPEYWLTHANIDKLWAAGVPIRQTIHAGRHAHEDARHVDVRDQRVVELRTELAARPRLLRVGGHQAGDLPGDRGSRHAMWNDTIGLRPAAS